MSEGKKKRKTYGAEFKAKVGLEPEKVATSHSFQVAPPLAQVL